MNRQAKASRSELEPSSSAWRPAVLMVLLAFVVLPAGAAAAEGPRQLWKRCDGGSEDLACSIARGVAVDPLSGNVYVSDSAGPRIVEFTAWGQFLRTWGWGVRDGANEFQICTEASSCQAGKVGSGVGQFSAPQGIAVDSSRNVYVADWFNHRVQKFDSEGHFLLMFGGQVNKTKVEAAAPEAEQNRCPVSPGDVCQAGTEGSAGKGQFKWPLSVAGSFIAVGPAPAKTVYVGDEKRIQLFEPNGAYKADLSDPEGILAANTVKSLAGGPGGSLFVALASKPDVRKLSTTTGATLCTAKAEKPMTVASDGKATGTLYVFDETSGGVNGEVNTSKVRQYSSTGTCADKEVPFAQGVITPPGRSTGLAAGTACLTSGADVYLSNTGPSWVQAYGAAPNVATCPKPAYAPDIVSQFAVSVDTNAAQLRASINPRFYSDTSYYVQYGTAACLEGGWEAACVKEQPAPPGVSLGAEAVDFPFTSAGVFLNGLTPATAYRYRFVAKSGGGGPVFGVGGKVGEDGAVGTFTTFAPPAGVPSCPNQVFRTGASARLPDCRAYEMVSPLDKEGGDILTLEDSTGRFTSITQSAVSGDKLTYSTSRSFGDAQSAPYTSQYIASREEGVGWRSEGISPPRGTAVVDSSNQIPGFKREYGAFSADLCKGWLVHDNTTAPPLAPGAEELNYNLYRRSSCGGDAGDYETLGKANIQTQLQGISADGGKAIFRTNGHLTQDAPTAVGSQLECRPYVIPPESVSLSYQWLSDGAPILGATSFGYTAQAGDAGKTIQCQLTATGASAGSTQVANPAWVIEPFPGTAPPLAPSKIPAPEQSEELAVGGGGGQTLSCDPNEAGWEGSPEFSYLWYRNGTAIAGAEEQTYEVTAGDLATAAAFQCEAIGVNAGGKVAKASAVRSTSPAPATPGASPNMTGKQEVVYESYGGGKLRSVCILPGGTASNGCSAGTANGFPDGRRDQVSGALSADGSRIFWTNSTGGVGRIYARIDGEETVPVSESVETENHSRFWAASADGGKALFSFDADFIGANDGPKIDDLYEYDVDTETPTLIAHEVFGVLGASTDLSRVYFVSKEDLSGEEANSEGAVAEEGKPNLYLYRAGEGSFSFIGTLAAADVRNEDVPSPVAFEPYLHSARVTPNGESVAFMARASLTGYDNTDLSSGEADAEVYRYGAGTDRLACVSCNPTGGRPAGRQLSQGNLRPLKIWAAARLPFIENQLYASNALSEDGSRLFFESFEPLVLADTNARQDVYEWEAVGGGTCSTASTAYSPPNGGCISLISSGESPVDSDLLDASPSGRDVFFATGSSLLPADPGSIDVYDARAGGGLSAPATPQPPCEGEACQSPSAPPDDATPSSSTFEGAGNQHPRKHKHHRRGHRKHRRGHGNHRGAQR